MIEHYTLHGDVLNKVGNYFVNSIQIEATQNVLHNATFTFRWKGKSTCVIAKPNNKVGGESQVLVEMLQTMLRYRATTKPQPLG